MTLLHIEEPATRAGAWHTGHPLLRLGFRPFYLLAARFAAIAIPLWMAHYFGWLPGGLASLAHVDLAWHMHEMLFGMAVAVVVGFLYTAARNWTGLWTPRRGNLAALADALARRPRGDAAGAATARRRGRLAVPAAGRVSDVACEATAGNKRNIFLVGLLGLMALANLVFHASILGWLPLTPFAPIQAAILVIVIIESVIGTRIIPMFTRNGAPGTTPLVQPMLDRVSLGLLAASALAWVAAAAPAWLFGPLALAAAALVLLRLWRWQALRTLSVPLLWIMHLSYAWIAVGFVLLALSGWQLVSASAGFHALAVGSMAGLILGMMTRTTLGHTGRPLKAGRAERAMFVLIQLSALSRVLSALGWDNAAGALLLASAACWAVAFGLYALVYRPYLANARVDGKPG